MHGVYLFELSSINIMIILLIITAVISFEQNGMTFTNDKYPRSKQYPGKFQTILLKEGASIGANATILGGVTIGKNALIGAGSVVTKNVPTGELWVGNPAKFVRKIEKE